MTADLFTRRTILSLAIGLLSMGVARADEAAPDLSGTWTWTWKDAEGQTHQHVLEVEGVGEKLSARERLDELEPVKVNDLKVDGKDVRFSVLRGDSRATYKGTIVSAGTINGTVTTFLEGGQPMEFGWTAQRKSANP